MGATSTHRKIVASAEVLLRLSPAGTLKIIESKHMEFSFGGTQMNVGASLACFREMVQDITTVSTDMVSMPTGGVSPSRENLTRWFNAGPHCEGIGSDLFWKKKDGCYNKEIKETLAAALEIIATLRT